MVFQNLFNNALKFAKNDTPPKIDVSAKRKQGNFEFAIKDNGIGIEEQYFQSIFMIFQRLHIRSEYEGNGIGLSHCKKVINSLGGDIWVESQLNIGTTFLFTIQIK